MPELEAEDLLVVKSCGIHVHVLREGEKLFLIDAGFISGISALDRALHRKGWQDLPVAGMVVTHGHIDHIAHAGVLAKRYGAWIAVG